MLESLSLRDSRSPEAADDVTDWLTRQQLAAILYHAADSPAASGITRFSDVAAGAYYVDAASWAADNGLVNGYQDGRFGVGDNVTRQQVIAILWRWAGNPDASTEDYTDDSAISGYAQTAVDWARANNIMAGREDGRFDPATPDTRVEIVSALYQYMNRSSGSETPAIPETPNTPSAGGRVLVAYFSATNNTEGIANHLGTILDADLYEITPEQPYTSADLNYNNTDCRANREQNDASARPAISGSVDNMEQYDVIFLGYPNWWASIPMPVMSFLEEYDFSGRTIVPFCSHGGGRFGQSLTAITKLAPDAVLGKGLAVSYSGDSGLSDDVTTWLAENSSSENN